MYTERKYNVSEVYLFVNIYFSLFVHSRLLWRPSVLLFVSTFDRLIIKYGRSLACTLFISIPLRLYLLLITF